MVRKRVRPGNLQYWIGEFTSFFLIQFTNLQEDLRQNVLIEAAISGRRQGNTLPLQPARRVDEGAILLGEASPGQAIDRRIDLLHVVGRGARRLPEGTSLVGINLAHHQEISL